MNNLHTLTTLTKYALIAKPVPTYTEAFCADLLRIWGKSVHCDTELRIRCRNLGSQDWVVEVDRLGKYRPERLQTSKPVSNPQLKQGGFATIRERMRH